MKPPWKQRSARIALLLAAILWMSGACARPASAFHLDEVLIFDPVGDKRGWAEGVVRQRVGLLSEDGEPVGGANPVVPIISPDMKRQALPMTGPDANLFANSFEWIKEDGGIVTIITHGNVGMIVVDGNRAKGFGTGTGAVGDCFQDPVQLDAARTNVTVNLAACRGNKSSGRVTSVAGSLTAEIQRRGGSVQKMNASNLSTESLCKVRVRWRNGYVLLLSGVFGLTIRGSPPLFRTGPRS